MGITLTGFETLSEVEKKQMGFKNFLRDYFTFNRRERNGVFVLLSIIILLLLYLSFSDLFFPKEKTDFSKFEKEIADFEIEQKKAADSTSDSHKNYFSGNNLVSDSDETERRFQKKEWKHFEKKTFSSPKGGGREGALELNSADTTSLKALKGIGSAFAKRILKLRDALGGFVTKEQLMEVYGFDKEKYDLISPQIEIDLSKVKKININTASVDDLRKHPYMNKKAAVKIFFQRVNHGDFADVQDVLKFNLADEDVYSKLAPYLTIQ